MSDHERSLVFLVIGAMMAGLVFLWWVIFGTIATDVETFDKVDNGGNCYLHYRDVNNMWLTPGDSYTIRETLCKEK